MVFEYFQFRLHFWVVLHYEISTNLGRKNAKYELSNESSYSLY